MILIYLANDGCMFIYFCFKSVAANKRIILIQIWQKWHFCWKILKITLWNKYMIINCFYCTFGLNCVYSVWLWSIFLIVVLYEWATQLILDMFHFGNVGSLSLVETILLRSIEICPARYKIYVDCSFHSNRNMNIIIIINSINNSIISIIIIWFIIIILGLLKMFLLYSSLLVCFGIWGAWKVALGLLQHDVFNVGYI